MNHLSALPSQAAARQPLWLQMLTSMVGGWVLFVFLSLGFLLAFEIHYAGRIYPGVQVAGVSLSGLTPEEAVARLNDYLDYPVEGKILFRDGERIWAATPAQLGLFLDPEGTVRTAYRLGRQGSVVERLGAQLRMWRSPVGISPQMVYDERQAQAFIESLAVQVNIPVVEAKLAVEGTQVVVQPGQVGRQVDVWATLDALRSQLNLMRDGIVPLMVQDVLPVVQDVEAQAELARRMLSAPLTLRLPDEDETPAGPWVFDPETLAGMLTIERVTLSEGGARYQVGLDSDTLRLFLHALAPKLERQAANARFIFDDDTGELVRIQDAVVGRTLDIEATIQQIHQQLSAGEHEIPLVFIYTQPEVGDDATAEQLGITQLVSVQSSYFFGSSAARIQNIQTASAQFHGLLVAPGETFSMGEVLGDISLDTGYAEAWIIYGDRTIKGVGGGVCQVSTTLFRTVFFGGYQIDERHSHAYRVTYYEQTASGRVNPQLAGLDATVFFPLVDFKFTNDSPYWILMETYVDPSARRLTWKFYSTSDGRTVEWSTTGLRNKNDPPDPLYQENPELEKGEIKQVDWAVEGADVTITRIVRLNGEILHEDVFETHYMPWRAVCEYGPGTKGMPPKKPDPDNPCQPDSKKDR